MTGWSTITWDTARAGGFAGYILLTLAVTAGLILRNRWQSDRWPRLITNEVHGYLSLLGLVFIAVHVAAVTIDPFTHFGLAAVLLPFVTHYRPLWMSLGIVSLYLLLAVWISSRLRARIGHALWRRIHLLAFLVYAGSTVHGLGTGSDTKTGWALVIYGASVTVVGALSARRLLVPVTRTDRRRPVGAALTGLAVVGIGMWVVAGPLSPYWGARAKHANGALAAAKSAPAGAKLSAGSDVSSGVVRVPFRASFSGTVSVSSVNDVGLVTVRIHGALHGGTKDHLEILVHGAPLDGGGVSMQASRVLMGRATAVYSGQIDQLNGNQIVATVSSGADRLRLRMSLHFGDSGTARGTVRGTLLGATA